MTRLLPLFALLLAAGCDTRDTGQATPPRETDGRTMKKDPATETTAGALMARADLVDPKGQSVGTATFEPMKPSGVKIHLDLRNLPPGQHAIHIHEKAKCDPPDFESAGEHFSPKKHEHGLENPKGPHAGDLPNITVGQDGRLKTTLENPRVTLGEGETSLLAGNGTALVIHTGVDDQKTNPAGGAGGRIACGPIKKLEAEKEAK